MDFESAIKFIARVNPRLNITQVLGFAAELTAPVFDFSTPDNRHEGLVHMVLNTPAVLDELKRGRKIAAIKELRSVLADQYAGEPFGLKECKDAVEDERARQASDYQTSGANW